jgi:DNA invertase Pin-like site-specific DNA recombinase
MMTFMKARFAQQFRDQVRKHTRDAMRQKAEQGFVTGGIVFGYDNSRSARDTSNARSTTPKPSSCGRSTNASPPVMGLDPSPVP